MGEGAHKLWSEAYQYYSSQQRIHDIMDDSMEEESEVVKTDKMLDKTRGSPWSLVPCSQPSFSIDSSWYTKVNDIWVLKPCPHNFWMKVLVRMYIVLLGIWVHMGCCLLMQKENREHRMSFLELIPMRTLHGWTLVRGFLVILSP